MDEVKRALAQSGLVMGEFGFVERLENQLARVRIWLEDRNERVRALPHTTRAALTGLKKKGHTIVRDKRGELTCYRIWANA